MVLDSLRYWVQECHVDGFRFDLAVALGRGQDDATTPTTRSSSPLRTDPVLSRVKLIAEPWDVGIHGWRTGQFPPPFSEWNDRYRDARADLLAAPTSPASARGGAGHGVRDLATRLAGLAGPLRHATTAAPSRRSTSSPPTTASRSPT